jgi:hypothetical protein
MAGIEFHHRFPEDGGVMEASYCGKDCLGGFQLFFQLETGKMHPFNRTI